MITFLLGVAVGVVLGLAVRALVFNAEMAWEWSCDLGWAIRDHARRFIMAVGTLVVLALTVYLAWRTHII